MIPKPKCNTFEVSRNTMHYLDYITKEEVQNIRNCAVGLYSFIHPYDLDNPKLQDLRVCICLVHDSYKEEFELLRKHIACFRDYQHSDKYITEKFKDVLSVASKRIAEQEMQMIQRQINSKGIL